MKDTNVHTKSCCAMPKLEYRVESNACFVGASAESVLLLTKHSFGCDLKKGEQFHFPQKCRWVVVNEMTRIQLNSLNRCVTPTLASLGGWLCAQPLIMHRTRDCYGIEGSPAEFRVSGCGRTKYFLRPGNHSLKTFSTLLFIFSFHPTHPCILLANVLYHLGKNLLR